MNPVRSSRTRADEFDRLVSGSAARARSTPGAPGRYDDLLGLVDSLRDSSPPEPRHQFSLDLRSRLLDVAESALAPDSAEQSSARQAPVVRRSPRERRLALAVGGFAIISATGSMAVTAQSALPGDTLYPFKRALENAQTGVRRDADGKGASLLGNAAGRLDEVGALSRSGEDDVLAVSSTLEDFLTQATEASELLLDDFTTHGRSSSIAELRSFTAESTGALTGLQGLIPRDARAALIEATAAISAIDVRAQALCPTCTDLPVLAAPIFSAASADTLLTDALGPVLDPNLPPPSSNGDAAPDRPSDPDRSSDPDQGPDGATGAGEGPAAPLPPGPKDPQDDGTTNDAGKGDGLLDDLDVTTPDDPLEDPLDGAGDGLGGVIDGLTGGLSDGLGDGLGTDLGAGTS